MKGRVFYKISCCSLWTIIYSDRVIGLVICIMIITEGGENRYEKIIILAKQKEAADCKMKLHT